MDFVMKILGNHLTEALGWFLIHSLWQGAIVALIIALALRLLKNRSAELRYYVAYASLLILLTVSIVTFRLSYHRPPAVQKMTPLMEAGISQNSAGPAMISVENEDRGFEIDQLIMEAGISRHFRWVVGLWILGLLVFFLRTSGGFIRQYYISHYGRISVSSEWHLRINELAEMLRIRYPIRIFGSEKILSPITSGFIKPLILVPAGFLADMPAAQLEAILLHELAHVRRHDYLLNLIQVFIETIFFYHPGIWLIAYYIRKERENACDDIAVQNSKDKLNYARALAEAQRSFWMSGKLAMGFSSGKHAILNRIKRLNTRRIMKTKLTEKLFAGAIIICAFLLFSFIIEGRTKTSKKEKSEKESVVDSTGNKQVTIVKTIVDSTGKATTTKEVYEGTDSELDSLLEAAGHIHEKSCGKEKYVKVIVTDDETGDELTEDIIIKSGDKTMLWKADKEPMEFEGENMIITEANGKKNIIIKKYIGDVPYREAEIHVEVLSENAHPQVFKVIVPEISDEMQEQMEREMEKALLEREKAEIDIEKARKEIEEAEKEMQYMYQYHVTTGDLEAMEAEKLIMMDREKMLEVREKALQKEMELLEKELKAVQKEIKKQKKQK